MCHPALSRALTMATRCRVTFLDFLLRAILEEFEVCDVQITHDSFVAVDRLVRVRQTQFVEGLRIGKSASPLFLRQARHDVLQKDKRRDDHLVGLDADGIFVLCHCAGTTKTEHNAAEPQHNDQLRCIRHAHEPH